jgi:ASC-1-like (ASCH) protein
MLNESLAPRDILSEGLKYHMDANKPLTEHLYRAGSDSYFNLWAEARSLYSREILEITHEDDLEILTETDLGHFGIFEGKKVPLDFPIELNEQMDIYDDIANSEFGMDYDQLGDNEKEWVRDEIDNMSMNEVTDEKFVKGIELLRSTLSKEGGAAGLEPLVKALSGLGFSKDEVVDLIKKNINIKQHRDGDYILLPLEEAKKLTYNNFVQMVRDDMMAGASPDEKPSDEQVKKRAKAYYNDYLQGASVDSLFEAKKKAKKNNKKLNKPMRDSSGGKAYKVYVKDPKTKKIKTIRFGSGGLRAKINDKKARNAFAKRHNCSAKKDKTKAGYWSCRLPRYAKLLGLKSNFGGFW